MKIPPIQRGDTVQQIVLALKELILGGDLEPGTPLPSERELSERLEVSRFSLREALRVTQAQGLIEIRQGRRPRVAVPSAAPAAEVIALSLKRSRNTLLDLVVARQGLETQAARVAARRISEQALQSLERTIRVIESHPSDLGNCVEQDLAFHEILVTSTDNPVFRIMLAPLTELLRQSRKRTIRRGIDRVILGHGEILAALRKRDPEAAAQAMYRHLEMAEEDLRTEAELSRLEKV
jgi:GntR family transcriptional repressor for pyruvate dehydrogenase complex